MFLETQVAQSRFAKQQEATRADGLAAQVCGATAHDLTLLATSNTMRAWLLTCCVAALPFCLYTDLGPSGTTGAMSLLENMPIG